MKAFAKFWNFSFSLPPALPQPKNFWQSKKLNSGLSCFSNYFGWTLSLFGFRDERDEDFRYADYVASFKPHIPESNLRIYDARKKVTSLVLISMKWYDFFSSCLRYYVVWTQSCLGLLAAKTILLSAIVATAILMRVLWWRWKWKRSSSWTGIWGKLPWSFFFLQGSPDILACRLLLAVMKKY